MSEPHDSFEQEADRVADRVLRMSERAGGVGGALSGRVQRRCVGCERELDRQPLQENEEHGSPRLALRAGTDRLQRVVEGDVTRMSITPAWAEALTDSELEAQVGIVRQQLTSSVISGAETEVARQNLEILEQEVFLRQATLEIVSPAQDARFDIDATPAMPAIACRARIDGNLAHDPTPDALLDWRITVTETVAADSCASARIGSCEFTVTQDGVRGGAWNVNAAPDFPSDRIQGGDAVIEATTTVRSRLLTASRTIAIRGTNPAAASITAACGGAGTDADRVACHESGRHQFDDGMPLLGPGGDVGVMQLCSPAASCEQRWSWSANVAAGVTLLGGKQAVARRYLNRHVVDGHYPNSLGLDDNQVLQRETLQRYNGGHYWAWNAATGQWEPDPPNEYVARVLGCA